MKSKHRYSIREKSIAWYLERIMCLIICIVIALILIVAFYGFILFTLLFL